MNRRTEKIESQMQDFERTFLLTLHQILKGRESSWGL